MSDMEDFGNEDNIYVPRGYLPMEDVKIPSTDNLMNLLKEYILTTNPDILSSFLIAKNYKATNCIGYTILAEKDIHIQDLIILCDRITFRLNKNYFKKNNERDFNKYDIRPELIYEGGLIWYKFPGVIRDMDKEIDISKHEYKTMRFNLNENYPLLDKEYKKCRKQLIGNTKKLLSRGHSIKTKLFAHNGAPKWTVEELELFEEEFGKIGLRVIKETYPLPCIEEYNRF